MNGNVTSRRGFVRGVLCGAAAPLVLPAGVLRGASAPSNRISLASIGVGMNAAGESDAEALVQLADGALYQAKAAGRNTWRLATAPAAPSTAAP